MPVSMINPYLNFAGDCRAAMTHYADVLGGTVEAMMSAAGTPMEEHVPAERRDMIIHACVQIGDDRLMASDAPPDYYSKPQGTSVSLHFDDAAEGQRIFEALSEGGMVTMPFQATFWSKGFGTCTDKFGTPWMINCTP